MVSCMTNRRLPPEKVPVQLNVQIPYEFREHLSAISDARRIPMAQLIRDALYKEYPLDPKGVRDATRQAGATK